MDNATHTLCALALARTGIDRLGPWTTGALIAGANVPDLDIVVSLTHGPPGYLCYHRGVTHGVLGLALQAPLVAAIAFGIGRARDVGVRFLPLLLAAAVGLASHLALDSLNTYGVRPWLPFDGRWYYGDLAFIVDPWLWLAFGAAAALGAPKPTDARPRQIWGWILFSALITIGMLSQTRAEPGLIPVVWGGSMAGLIALRRRGVMAERRSIAATLGLALAAGYLGLLAVGSSGAAQLARQRVAEVGAGPVEVVSVQPVPGSVRRWRAAVSTRERTWQLEVHPFGGDVEVESDRARNLDDPALALVEGTAEHAAWRCFARHPYVDRWEGQVLLGDARYAPVARPGWCNLVVPGAAATPTSGSASRPSPSR